MLFGSKNKGGASWLVAFLGNPGDKYAKTRHNAGFMAGDALEKKLGIKINKLKFQALTGLGELAGQKVFFVRPQTFMNLSGDAIAPAAAFYKIPPERVIVVFDDIAIQPGKLRVKRSGSAGGHNGIKSIIQRLGTDGFPRVKIGVGAPPHPDYDMIDWVIGRIGDNDYKTISAAAERAVDAVEEIISAGIDSAMNKYNG